MATSDSRNPCSGIGDNSYIVVEEILPSVGSQKCGVVLVWYTNLIWDYKARHMANVCDMQQTPIQIQIHFFQKCNCPTHLL